MIYSMLKPWDNQKKQHKYIYIWNIYKSQQHKYIYEIYIKSQHLMAKWCIVQNQYPTLSKMLNLKWKSKTPMETLYVWTPGKSSYSPPKWENKNKKERTTTKLLIGDISFSNITYLVNILVLSWLVNKHRNYWRNYFKKLELFNLELRKYYLEY